MTLLSCSYDVLRSVDHCTCSLACTIKYSYLSLSVLFVGCLALKFNTQKYLYHISSRYRDTRIEYLPSMFETTFLISSCQSVLMHWPSPASLKIAPACCTRARHLLLLGRKLGLRLSPPWLLSWNDTPREPFGCLVPHRISLF